jgi:hypothetical protein
VGGAAGDPDSVGDLFRGKGLGSIGALVSLIILFALLLFPSYLPTLCSGFPFCLVETFFARNLFVIGRFYRLN